MIRVFLTSLALYVALAACGPRQPAVTPTPTPTDLQRLCARPTATASDVIAQALEDACLQIGTPEAGR